MKLVGARSDGVPDGTRPGTARAHATGIHHFSAHLLVVRNQTALARRRHQGEDRYAGLLTTTLGGAVMADGSPDDALRTAAIRFGLAIGPLRYVGTFEVRDDFEQETCTLWTTADLDGRGSEADFIDLPIDQLDPHRCTPHLRESLRCWEASC